MLAFPSGPNFNCFCMPYKALYELINFSHPLRYFSRPHSTHLFFKTQLMSPLFCGKFCWSLSLG